MNRYDVVVVGGGIADSLTSRTLAESGFKTILLEKFKTPRNKPCSGIQFSYFEKLIGEKIPRDRLCRNELNRVVMVTPKGSVVKGRIKMLNFWRLTFDRWLNDLAIGAGAEFQDETSLKDYQIDGEWMKLNIFGKDGRSEVMTRYLIGADGMLSKIRQKLKPKDFARRYTGATINYYFKGKAELDPNTLYIFFKREFCPMMFSWVYLKDDEWVVGTGAKEDPKEYAERFFKYIKEKYSLSGRVVKKEGFTSTMQGGVYLGEANVLLAGDAASLVDLHRGMGMDNAALSSLLAARAIVQAEDLHLKAIELYQTYMKKVVDRLRANRNKHEERYASDESLERSLSRIDLIKDGLKMLLAHWINRFLPPEKLIFLPP
ncbi:MAG: FAD-dependent monooxygenase [Thermoproteota archaeon]